MALDELKYHLGKLGHSLASGWASLIERAGQALTRFRSDKDDAGSSPSWGVLAADMVESDEVLTLTFELPGMDPDALNIHIEGEQLVVSGQKSCRQSRRDGTWHITECSYGAFERRFSLPVEVIADKSQATYQKGILTLVLPLSQPREKPRKIPITFH